MSRNIRRILAVVVPVVVLALTPAATSAGGPGQFGKNTTTVAIKSVALATGGVTVNLRYSCFPGGYGPYSTFGQVRVVEADGSQGFTFFNPACNDTTQSQSIFVQGNFGPGAAAIQATVCGFDCNGDTREVKLR
ncbi:MAG: hypothetical protein QOH92_1625 [Chloroflexota bacterium]|jgi:hypothetical protein|nr:hypothetical protein [Chloroflexota bacterium]